ncbi:MAG: spondin domain-containing protein [Kangiellaceae bacterium]|nr:spondin domain-containing protein [Kangiellaceae bacterium]
MAFASAANAGGAKYEVQITNITKSISFTPIMVAAHHNKVDLFELGEVASDAIADVAEGGNTSGIAAMYTNPYDQVASTSGLLQAGQTATLTFENVGRHVRFSVASMLLPTNDAFVALESVRAPRKYASKTRFLKAYDAGSETNDESCASIPGPTCGGEPFSPNDEGEGYVYVHSGIHGIGDLSASEYTWNNPVLKVSIRRVK